MIISDIEIESEPLPFYKGKRLETNNLGSSDSIFMIILRDPNILLGYDFFMLSSLGDGIGSFSTDMENTAMVVYPSDTSSVIGPSAKDICVSKSEREEFLYLQTSRRRRSHTISGGSFIYINGSITEVFQRKSGSISCENNCSMFQARRLTRYMEAGDYLEFENLSVYCIHDVIFTSFVFWKLADTCPYVRLTLEWEGANASFKLINEVGCYFESLKIEKYTSAGETVVVNSSRNYFSIYNYRWSPVYLNLKDGNFYENDYCYSSVYPSFEDGLSERWFRSIKFENISAPIYFSDILIANLPSSSNHLFTKFYESYDLRKKVYDLLNKGNFYWEP